MITYLCVGSCGALWTAALLLTEKCCLLFLEFIYKRQYFLFPDCKVSVLSLLGLADVERRIGRPIAGRRSITFFSEYIWHQLSRLQVFRIYSLKMHLTIRCFYWIRVNCKLLYHLSRFFTLCASWAHWATMTTLNMELCAKTQKCNEINISDNNWVQRSESGLLTLPL